MAAAKAVGGGTKPGRARRAGRAAANLGLLAIVLGALGAWAWLGVYQLQPGQAAVILRLGQYVRTEPEPGLKWRLPPPIESHRVVNVAAIEREEFGYRGAAPTTGADAEEARAVPVEQVEASMQTRDNNIVYLSFVVQYKLKDAFQSLYRVAAPRSILRDAAQAAVREVVARTSVDGVLSQQRGAVEAQAEEILQDVLDRYEAGIAILAVQLQDVQPPPDVRNAFDDVIAAIQDKSRSENEARGYENSVIPVAQAEQRRLVEAAMGYRDARVAEAEGEASRFEALAAEYKRNPEVVRTRLYLETMEEVLPSVRQVVIEPGTAVLPHFPLLDGAREGGK